MKQVPCYLVSIEPGDMTHYDFYIIHTHTFNMVIAGRLIGCIELELRGLTEFIKAYPSILEGYDKYRQANTESGAVAKLAEIYPKINPWTTLAAYKAAWEQFWDVIAR